MENTKELKVDYLDAALTELKVQVAIELARMEEEIKFWKGLTAACVLTNLAWIGFFSWLVWGAGK